MVTSATQIEHHGIDPGQVERRDRKGGEANRAWVGIDIDLPWPRRIQFQQPSFIGVRTGDGQRAGKLEGVERPFHFERATSQCSYNEQIIGRVVIEVHDAHIGNARTELGPMRAGSGCGGTKHASASAHQQNHLIVTAAGGGTWIDHHFHRVQFVVERPGTISRDITQVIGQIGPIVQMIIGITGGVFTQPNSI